ncbi:50S ribosomal subunit protein L29 [Desulfovibrionales bacterium]
MNAKEVHALSENELTEKLAGFREELFKLRFQHAIGQLEKTARIPQVKQNIARVITILKVRKQGV